MKSLAKRLASQGQVQIHSPSRPLLFRERNEQREGWRGGGRKEASKATQGSSDGELISIYYSCDPLELNYVAGRRRKQTVTKFACIEAKFSA